MCGRRSAERRSGRFSEPMNPAHGTALFLWTLQSSNGISEATAEDETVEADEPDDDDEIPKGKAKSKGFGLPYDVVRRFAQPLGIHLEAWDKRIIETDKGVVTLLAVKERALQLFGEEGAHAVASELEQDPAKAMQMSLFGEVTQTAAPSIRGRSKSKKGSGSVTDEELQSRREATTLDRVHAAMLLQKSGRSNALRALLTAEQQRGSDFVRLANALSALYPKESEEKRLVDAMLLAVPR
jgi:putative DNA methylase